MRTLHCVPSFYGAGIEKLLAGLAQALQQRGGDVHVTYVQGGPHLEALLESGVTLHPLEGSSFYDPRTPLRVLTLLRKLRPDVMHTWLPQMDIVAGYPALFAGVPHVLTEGSEAGMYVGSEWKNQLRATIARRARGIIANSEGGAAYWAGLAPDTRRWVIPNGLPLDDIRAAPAVSRRDLGVDEGQTLVLYAGRLHPDKNAEIVGRAIFRALRDTAAVGVFCGYGPSRELLEEIARTEGVADRVRMMGFVPSVWPYMKAADVLVSATRMEGRPNVALEAIACGCPLIVSEIPAYREFLSERTAVFVPHDDSAAIAAAIAAVLREPDAARVRAAAALRDVRLLSLEQYAAAHEEVYAAVTRAPRHSPGERSLFAATERKGQHG